MPLAGEEIFAIEDIPPNTKFVIYGGHILNSDESQKQDKQQRQSNVKKKASYLVILKAGTTGSFDTFTSFVEHGLTSQWSLNPQRSSEERWGTRSTISLTHQQNLFSLTQLGVYMHK
jgi:hypothetical protein